MASDWNLKQTAYEFFGRRRAFENLIERSTKYINIAKSEISAQTLLKLCSNPPILNQNV